jgi:hypothetical protein
MAKMAVRVRDSKERFDQPGMTVFFGFLDVLSPSGNEVRAQSPRPRNEAEFIEKTLASMVLQTILPERWFIVDDGSTDRTTEIVAGYAKRFSWIELVRQPLRPRAQLCRQSERLLCGP